MNEETVIKFTVGAKIADVSLSPTDATRHDSLHIFLDNGAILTVSFELYEGLRVGVIGPSGDPVKT
jgi:ABC-type glutathione transport system ATPase component